jgi:hypothetical protein
MEITFFGDRVVRLANPKKRPKTALSKDGSSARKRRAQQAIKTKCTLSTKAHEYGKKISATRAKDISSW